MIGRSLRAKGGPEGIYALPGAGQGAIWKREQLAEGMVGEGAIGVFHWGKTLRMLNPVKYFGGPFGGGRGTLRKGRAKVSEGPWKRRLFGKGDCIFEERGKSEERKSNRKI